MDDTEIDLRNIFGLLQRRLRLILTTATVVIGLAIITLFALTNHYTSTALILVETGNKDLLNANVAQSIGATDNARVDSEVGILRSDNILMSVVASQDLVRDKEFGASPDLWDQLLSVLRIKPPVQPTGNAALQKVLRKLRAATHIERDGLTFLISVSVTSQDPDKAARLANSIAHTYIDLQVGAKVASIQGARDVLEAQLSSATQSIVASEQAFDQFIKDNIDTIITETGQTALGELHQDLLRNEAESTRLIHTVSSAQAELELADWAGLSQRLGDQVLARLNQQRNETTNRLNKAAEPVAGDLRAELSRIDRSLEQTAQSDISALRKEAGRVQGDINDLRRQLRSEVLQSDLSARILARIFELQQNSEIARTHYRNLLNRINSLDAQSQSQIADSRIVSKALASDDPSFPNVPLSLSFAVIAAAGLGVGLAFLYENFVGGFINTKQVQNVLHLPGSFAVPQVAPNMIPMGESKASSAADFMQRAPLSPFAESIRRVRLVSERMIANQRANGGQKRGAVILVSSAVPGEGKSTIALSLARAFAQAGKSTYLIDCDLRKPSLHKYMGFENDVGLADYLRQPDDPGLLSKIVMADPESALATVVGSHRSDVPTDQLSGGASLSKLIDVVRSKADFVILDSPPILPVIDGLYLAEHADAIAMVIRWASTSQNEVRDALSALCGVKRANTDVFAILNQQQSGMNGYQVPYGGYYNS